MKFVIASTATEPVIAIAAKECVVSFVGANPVIPGTTKDQVISRLPTDLIITGTAKERVIAVSETDILDPCAPDIDVITGRRSRNVIAVTRNNKVWKAARIAEGICSICANLQIEHTVCEFNLFEVADGVGTTIIDRIRDDDGRTIELIGVVQMTAREDNAIP